MSLENVKLFFEKLSIDEQLMRQFQQLTDDHFEVLIKKIIEFGGKRGFEFSKEDMIAFEDEVVTRIVERNEFMEDEMEPVVVNRNDHLHYMGEVDVKVSTLPKNERMILRR